MSEPTQTPSRRRPVREFLAHLVDMPKSHKIILTFASVLAVGGLIGVANRKIAVTTSTAVSNASGQQQQNQQTTPGHGFVSSDSAPTSSTAATTAPAPPPPTLTERISPHAMRVGLGLIGGFIIGWAFRAFVKMMATISFFGVAILVGLSYFNVRNVDFSSAETKFKSSTEWVTDQATRAKDAAMAHVPGSASSLVGLWLGFRRR